MDQIERTGVLRQLGRNIRAERARHEWTQEGLAHEAGLGVAQVARMERGELYTGIIKYILVARALGVAPALLLQGVE